MIDIQICSEIDAQAWNRRVAQTEQGGFRQTTWYGDFKAQWRERALYFIARDLEGGIVGQLLVVLGSPWGWGLERRPFSSVTQPLAQWLVPHIYWQEGPLVFSETPEWDVRRALIKAVANEARDRRCLLAVGQPSHFAVDPAAEQSSYRQIAIDLGWSIDERTTLVIDLTQGIDALWANLRKEARTKVRKAQKQDIEIIQLDGDEEYLKLAHIVIAETAERNGVAPLSYTDFCRSHQYHSGFGVECSYLSLHEGMPLSYQKAICFNGNALLGGVAYSNYSRDRRLYGNDLMQWHIIEQGHEAGWRRLDFGGAEPDSHDPKMQGIYQFKSKWGGDLVASDRLRLHGPATQRLKNIFPKRLHHWVRGG